jgi:hypothetical protein
VQKQAVFERLDIFIKLDPELRVFTAASVRPTQRTLPFAQEGQQVVAGRAFQRLIDSGRADLNIVIIELAVQMLSVWSAPVHENWQPIFLRLLGRVRQELLSTTIVREILKLSDFNQAKTFRLAACSLTPALAPFVPDLHSRQLIRKSFDLAQDIEFSIRLRMAKELEKLIVIGKAFVEGELWQELLNLLEDDNDEVQKEALTLLLKALKMTTSGFREVQAVPCVIDALTKPYAAQVVLPWAGEVIQLCCKELETHGKLRVFMEFYRAQLVSTDPDTVLVAARCLPEVLLGLGRTTTAC